MDGTRSGGHSPDQIRSALVKYTKNCEGVFAKLPSAPQIPLCRYRSNMLGVSLHRACEAMYRLQIRRDAGG